MPCELCYYRGNKLQSIKNVHIPMFKKLGLLKNTQKSTCTICAACAVIAEEYYATLRDEARQERLQMKLEKQKLEEHISKMQVVTAAVNNSGKHSSSNIQNKAKEELLEMQLEKQRLEDLLKKMQTNLETPNSGAMYSLKVETEAEEERLQMQLEKDQLKQYVKNIQMHSPKENSEDIYIAYDVTDNCSIELGNGFDSCEIINQQGSYEVQLINETECEVEESTFVYEIVCDDSSVQNSNPKTETNSKMQKSFSTKSNSKMKTLECKTNSNTEKSSYRKYKNYYYCSLCTASKYANETLIQHHVKLMHHGFRFICTKCTNTYPNSRSLKTHYKSSHNIDNGMIVFDMPKRYAEKN